MGSLLLILRFFHDQEQISQVKNLTALSPEIGNTQNEVDVKQSFIPYHGILNNN